MWKFIALGLTALAITVFGFSLMDINRSGEVSASALMADVQPDISGYARAIEPWNWQFPRDHGPHPAFQTEWWYYTGNLEGEGGRRFGFQFTVFRRAITPTAYDTGSEWRADQVYMAHFTVTDVQSDRFYHEQRFSRGSAGLAGATASPLYHVWLEDWDISAQNDDATLTTIRADAGEFAVNLNLQQIKPPALHGDNGLSPKGDQPGNASYYYSLTRLLTNGAITVEGQTFTVTGSTWMDHEFSTRALADNAQGWDWFGLHLDDNRELMVGQIRLIDGRLELAYGGLLVNADGSTRYLESEDLSIEPTATWTSPFTNATYPAGWNITVHTGEEQPLRLTLTPLISDQELHTEPSYWEGAVRIGGDVSGYGYAELTGYVQAMTGRL